MRILQVCTRYHPDIGGVEVHVRNISERLSKNHEVTVATTDPTGKLAERDLINAVTVLRFKSWAPNQSYFFSANLRNYLKTNAHDFNVLHAHSYHAFPALYASQAKDGTRMVFTPHYHGKGHTLFRTLLHKPYKLLGKKIFKNADKIISVSEYEKSLLTKNFSIPEEKMIVIPNGIDPAEFTGLKKQNKNNKVILYVGRLEKYKGVHHLINALPKLDEDVILEIIGNGPYMKPLLKLSEKRGVTNRTKFLQNLSRKELLQEYVNADLFVSLSQHEAYGIVVAESLASGVPCLVANTSGLTEWIDNTRCFGVNFPINTDDLACRINENIGKKIDKPDLPSWQDITERIEKIYSSLLDS